jgi:hypothetical protein
MYFLCFVASSLMLWVITIYLVSSIITIISEVERLQVQIHYL